MSHSQNMSQEEVTASSHLGLTATERYIWAGWCGAILAVSLPGNTLVLLSSLKYRAIRLDKVTVVLVEGIAVADLGAALAYVFTRLTR